MSDGWRVGDRVEGWVRENSIPELRVGTVTSIDFREWYPVEVDLEGTPLQYGSSNLYRFAEYELTRIEQ